MRLAGVLALLPLTLAVIGCGGDKTSLAESARPCLAGLGEYLHHKRLPSGIEADPTRRLPVLDPENPPLTGRTTQRLAWPDDFEEYGEILYPPTQPGANAVQILIFGDDELPKQIVAVTREAERNQAFFGTGAVLRRIGQSILMWSSTPTAAQRRTVRACLEEW
jgi:hypothetical protein